MKKRQKLYVSTNKYIKAQNKLQNHLGCKVKVSEDKIVISFPKDDRKEVIGKILGDNK